jgi:anti-anti-sigma factor
MPAAVLNTSSARVSDRAVVSGRLCMSQAVVLRRRLLRLLDGGGRVLALDLSGVCFMDGAALAVVVEFAQACARSGVSLRLFEPSEQVWDAFSLYGLTNLLIEFAEYNEREGLLVVIEDDFPESISLPLAA